MERSTAGVRLAGRLRTFDARQVVSEVRRESDGARTLELDLGDVEVLDGGVVALLLADLSLRGASYSLRSGERFAPLFDLYALCVPCLPRRRKPPGILAEVGLFTLKKALEAKERFRFLGDLALATKRLLRGTEHGHWREVPLLIERAGVDAVPIVFVINFLIGFVTAYMAAQALGTFGAESYIGNLIGLAVTRQLAPLMTAIVVCGRSGAAFATELGSMKVSEEIDALRTLGLGPFGWMVMPRLLTLVIVLPMLTALADVFGVLGGLIVAVLSLDLSSRNYLSAVRSSVEPWDVGSGLVMSAAFGLAIGIVACIQGLAASGGPEGVGLRTTRTVVHALFAIVVLDAAFTIAYNLLGLS